MLNFTSSALSSRENSCAYCPVLCPVNRLLYTMRDRVWDSTCGYPVCLTPFTKEAAFYIMMCFWFPYWQSDSYSCLAIFLHLLLYSISLHICFVPSTY
jgi:hypothetical protein